jgi:hypothetical protein
MSHQLTMGTPYGISLPAADLQPHGIAMAVQLKRLLKHRNIELFEKSEEIGGTWSQNHYPNLSCDVPSEVGLWTLDTLSLTTAELLPALPTVLLLLVFPEP